MRAPTRTLFAGALLATSLAFAAMPSNPASAATSTIRVSIIGDESLAGLEDANKPTRDIITATYPMALDAACNRKTAVPQVPADYCAVGKVTTAAEVINGTTGGDLGEVLVMMTGYNDFPGVAPGGFAADVDAIMAAATAQGVQRVVWLNLRLEGATANQTTRWTANNATLAAKDTQYPNLVVANWNAASTGQSALFLASPEQYKIRTNQAGFLANFLKTTIDGNLTGITPPPPAPGAPSGSRCLAANAGGIVSPSPAPQAFSSDGKGSNYTPIAPARLLDTRAGDADQVNRAIGQGRLVRVDFSDRARRCRPAQRHPGQRHRRDAERHRGRSVQQRLRHRVPLWSGWPAAVVDRQLQDRPDRAERRHGQARLLQPGVLLQPGPERPRGRRRRVLLRRHRRRVGPHGCRSPAAPRHPSGPSRPSTRTRARSPVPPTSPSRSPAWARSRPVPPAWCST